MTLPLLVVSIDTEEDQWIPVREGISATNLRELPRVARLFERLHVRPTYFVTYQAARAADASAVVDVTADGGGEIGAHLHPWNTPPSDESFARHNWMLNNLPGPLQQSKLVELTNTLTERFGQRPTAFRAGRFGLGTATIGALAQCGYTVDSSVTPFWTWTSTDHGPDYRGAPVNVYRVSADDVRCANPDSPVLEVPLSSGFTGIRMARWNGLARWLETRSARTIHAAGLAARIGRVKRTILSPETDTVDDMLELSRRLLEGGAHHLHLFFHSSSLRAGLTPFTRTAEDVARLYTRVEEYVDRLAGVTATIPATVSEAATRLGSAVGAAAQPAEPMRRGRLLIVSYHFPPDGAVGGLRWSGLGKHLAALGWEVQAVTAAQGNAATSPDGVVVERCSSVRTLNDRYNAIARKLRHREPSSAAAPLGRSAPGSLVPRWLARIRAELASWLVLPDHGRGWVLRAAARTRRVARSWHPDIVVSSGPPHSAHMAAWLGTMGLPVRRLVDMRDPWATTGAPAGRWDPVQGTVSARWLIPLLERWVLRRATAIVTNTPELEDVVRRQYGDRRVQCIRNGVDVARLPVRQGAAAGLTLAYIGTLYGERSLRPVLDALARFVGAHPEARPHTRLRIAGHADKRHADVLAAELSLHGLNGVVEHVGMLSESGALELVARSHLAIVLAQGQALQVPAKLYESIGLGVPTLIVTEEGSATAREGERLGARVVRPDDTVAIERILHQVWTRGVVTTADARAAVDYATIATEMDRLLRQG